MRWLPFGSPTTRPAGTDPLPDLIVGGGATLQPVLYGARRRAGARTASESKDACSTATTAGGFADHRIPLNDYARGQGLQVLEIIDRAIEQGFLPAAPAEGCVPLVRLPSGVRSTRGRAGRAEVAGPAGRSGGAEVDAMSRRAPGRDRPARDRRRARRDAGRRGGGRDRQDDRARRADRPRARQRAADRRRDEADRRRHLHREGGRRAEAPAARGARAGAVAVGRRADVAARLDEALDTLEEAHVNTIHGFCAELLRERPVEAVRRSAVHGADRAAGRATLRARVRRLAAGRAPDRRRTGCGARCGGRARRSSADGDGGPVDRLRSAGRMLAEWRDFDAPWCRPSVRS